MLSPEEIATRFEIVPNPVSVTYTPQNPVQAPFTVAGARKRPLDGREAASAGITVTTDKTVWILPAINMPAGYQPRAGDVITENPGLQTAQDWQNLPQTLSGLMEEEWKLACRKNR